MKILLYLILSLTLVLALPARKTNLDYDEDDDDETEDGWFVPQADGSLKWVTEEENQLEMRALTMSRKKSKEAIVRFFMYSQGTPDEGEEVVIGDVDSLLWSGFDPKHKTRIIIHGWENNYRSDVNTVIRDALLSVGEYNVISVDWSDKAESWNYKSAKDAVPEIGQRVAKFIEFLRDEGHMQSKDLKVIGHSLGAHVAGFAGKSIEGEQIHTIIGLDTAFPLFKYKNCDERLCSTDALYVESIHTNGRLLGFIKPIGQAAFYPNGGRSQPGCGLDITGTCSHSRAYIYYAEAIKQQFLGVKCNHWKDAVEKDCPNDGDIVVAVVDNVDNHMVLEGTFYSPINNEPPYSFNPNE